MGTWVDIGGRRQVCVLAVFRYKKLAAAKLRAATDGSDYHIEPYHIKNGHV